MPEVHSAVGNTLCVWGFVEYVTVLRRGHTAIIGIMRGFCFFPQWASNTLLPLGPSYVSYPFFEWPYSMSSRIFAPLVA